MKALSQPWVLAAAQNGAKPRFVFAFLSCLASVVSIAATLYGKLYYTNKIFCRAIKAGATVLTFANKIVK